MQRTKPPFRADHVGSLLRSATLKEARARREKNEISAEQLKAVEDSEIEAIIRKQEAVGLKSVTDGEYRRAFWNYDFLGQLDGVEAYLGERKRLPTWSARNGGLVRCIATISFSFRCRRLISRAARPG